MRKIIGILICLVLPFGIKAQCLTDSIVINTAYNPVTNTALTAGTTSSPVQDPHWIIGSATSSISGAGGVGTPAFVIAGVGAWATNPASNPGRYISCVNSTSVPSDGRGTAYNTTLTRPFRMCIDDTVKFDLHISADNYVSRIDVDGIIVFGFSETGAMTSYFTSFTAYDTTIYLSAGTHYMNILLNNYNDVTALATNPMGLDVWGSIVSMTGISSIVKESDTACARYACRLTADTTCNTVVLADSVHLCDSATVALSASIVGTDSVISVRWYPPANFTDTTILNPLLHTGYTSQYYYINVKSLKSFNAVVNGDFEMGNYGFSSTYTYSRPPSSILYEGYYSVYSNPYGVHTGFTSMGDHTTGSGKMLIVNAGSTASDVWCQTISVVPNTDYDFSAWIANCSSVTTGTLVPIINFKINSVLIGTPDTVRATPGTWVNFHTMWNSGISTSANICLYDALTASGGNDFAIDDISFRQVCTSLDSIYVLIGGGDTTYSVKDTALCVTSAPLRLTHATATRYLWSTGATSASINVSTSGTYYCYGFTGCAVSIDTFNVTFIPQPVVNLGADTAFCVGNTLTLSTTQPAGYNITWSDGTTGSSIVASTTGVYWCNVNNGCSVTDSIHVTLSPYPVVDLGPDTSNCSGTPITLSSSGTYTSPTYQWSDGITAATDIVLSSGIYWLKVTDVGCSSSDTVRVNIIYDTSSLYNRDTAICLGQIVQVASGNNPNARYQWIPTAGIAISNIHNPTIAPDTSAMYYMYSYVSGCPPRVDSFYIDVQPNPTVSVGNFRFVCQYDTIHLRADVYPLGYTHYSYHWTPSTFLSDTTLQNIFFTAGTDSKYIVEVKTPAGCTGKDSVLVHVYPGDFLTQPTDVYLCPHDSAQIVIPSSNGGYAKWQPSYYLSDSTSLSPWVHPINSQFYTIYGTSSDGCKDTTHVNVHVYAAALVNLPDTVVLHSGESYHIIPQSNCSSFTWFPESAIDNIHIMDPTVHPTADTRYWVTGVTANGCAVTDSVNVIYDGSTTIGVPNAFTPDGSGNRTFKINILGEGSLNYFRVFDRWGNKLFETRDINEGWDGTFNGKSQPQDVYIYAIQLVGSDGKIVNKTGNLTLLH